MDYNMAGYPFAVLYYFITKACILLSLLVLGFADPFSTKHKAGAVREEYCMSETFHAQCARNEVIVMTQAQYGRMGIGRCVVVNLGYLGCATDALPFLDAVCSGVNECNFLVPSGDLDETKPCLQELRSYLEVSYVCVPVAMAEKEICAPSGSLKLLSSSGYLSSYIASEYSCGSLTAPWKVEVLPGQTINVTLMDFTTGGQTKCNPIGYITDLSGHHNQTICRSRGRREENIYSLKGQTVLIYINPPANVDKQNGHFLLKYQVSGCADLNAPAFAWYRREGDIAIVTCLHADKSWHLKCYNSQWQGVLGNCTHKSLAVTQNDAAVLNISHVVVIILIIVVAVGMVIIVLVCGYLYTSKLSSKLNTAMQYDKTNTQQGLHYDHSDTKSNSHGQAYHGPSGYAHVRDASMRESQTVIKAPSDSDYGSHSYMSSSQWRSIDTDYMKKEAIMY